MPTAELRPAYPDFHASSWQMHTVSPIVPETAVRVESSPVPRSLREELAYVEKNLQKEGLALGWENLEGTGFLIQTQMSFLKKNTPFAEWLVETEADLKGYTREYLEKKADGKENLVFPISYSIEPRGGRMRMVNKFHGGAKLLEETVSSKERNGAVKQALIEKIEPFFLDAPDGSIAYMVSPSGDSGMRDDQGEKIMFPDSFSFILQKRGNEVVGISVKTDFSNDEHREALARLTGVQLENHAPVEQYVKTVGLYAADKRHTHGIGSITDIIDVMRDTRLTQGSLYAHKNQSWEHVYKDASDMDALWKIDDHSQHMIAQFVEFAKNEAWDEPTLQKALALTVLRIKRIQERRSGSSTQSVVHISSTYGGSLDHLQAVAEGCAGGGFGSRKKSSLLSMVDRTVIKGEGKNGLCKSCGTVADCGICEACYTMLPAEEMAA